MLNKKEIILIILVSLILGFTLSLINSLELSLMPFLYTLLAIFLVILINVLAKKVATYYLDSEIEVKLWEVKRYGFSPKSQFKKPFPTGVFFPVIFTGLSLGITTWMACLTFDVKAKIHRAAKRHGLYSFSEMTEWHIGLIAASGILINLFFAIIGYLIGYSEFARFNIYYACFNLLPLSDLDGNKIFFGSIILWAFLTAIALVALGYAFWLV